MRRLVVMACLLGCLGAVQGADPATEAERGPAAPPALVTMANDADYDRILADAWDADPGPQADAHQQFAWLTMVAGAAELDRRYDLAAAADAALVNRWPHLYHIWLAYSNNLGRLGRFHAALDAARNAERQAFVDDAQVTMAEAAWTWGLGRGDQARAMMQTVVRPDPGTPEEKNWLLGALLFHAACDHDDAACRQAITQLFATPRGARWREVLSRDVAFDRLRGTDWFQAAVGVTATAAAIAGSGDVADPTATAAVPAAAATASGAVADTGPASAAGDGDWAALFHEPSQPTPGLERVAVAVPAAEIQARDEFTAACKRLAAGDWNAAALAARRSLKAADLPEAHLALALAEAGLDHADGVDRELDAFVAHGFALRYPLDIAGLQGASSGAQRMLRSSGAGQEAGALQLVVQAHLLRPWRQDELVIRYMDHAQRLAPGLAAVFGLRAAADLRLGHVEQAEDSLEEALRLQPGRPQTYFTLVSLDREHEHWADALAHLDLAVDNGGSALLADCHRACISADQGHWDEAERFLAGCGANARHVIVFEAAMEVAEDASRAGQSERAERIVRGLLAADPTALGAWDLLALTLLRAGHPQQALDAVQRIHEQYPDDAVTAAIAALVLAHLDRKAEAAAVMATLPPPTNDALGLQFRSYRALYAAAIGDQALMTQDLTAVLGGARHQRVLHWMAEDPLFAAYRAEAWFNDLPTATGAASATVAAPASDHGAEPKK